MMKKIMIFCLAALLTGIWSSAAATDAAVQIQLGEDGNFSVTVAQSAAAVRVKAPSGADIYVGDSATGDSQSFIIPMDDKADETGDYIFVVNGETYSVFYANAKGKKEAMEHVNAAQNEQMLGEALNTYQKELALGTDDWTALDKWGGVYTFLLKKLPYEEAGMFCKDIRQYTLVDGMNKAKDAQTAEQLIATYNEEFLKLDFSSTSDFKQMDAAAQKQVYEGMLHPSPAYSSPADIIAAHDKAVVVPLVNFVNWTKLETVMRKYQECIGVSFTGDYSKLNANTEVPELWKQMKQTTYTSTEQIAQRFHTLAASLAGSGSQTSNAGIGGGGGGGRGSSSADVSIGGDALPQPFDPGLPPSENLSKIFSDMGSSPWAATAVDYLAQTGIVSGAGNGNFEPERSVTREEFLKMLLIALELEGSGETTEFSDVEEGAWYAPYISTAKEFGITTGIGNGTFGIGQQISRQDMAVFAWRAMEAAGQLPESTGEKTSFADEVEISDYALEATYQMQQAGILSGVGDGRFAPHAYATRAQAAKMIYEMIG